MGCFCTHCWSSKELRRRSVGRKSFLYEDKIFGAVEFFFQTAVYLSTPQLEVTLFLTTRVIPENSSLVSVSVQ